MRRILAQLVLSLFPGIDLLGRGFEAEGFCVVRGPDLLWGSRVEDFHALAGRFDGVIAGSPCQDFSAGRRIAPSGEGRRLLGEFVRVVDEALPAWWLLENVSRVSDVDVSGYAVQRLDLNARECGSLQRRLRHFQFGSRDGWVLVPARRATIGPSSPTCMASEGSSSRRRSWADFCELQGLPRDFDLPGWSLRAKYAAVGNGVHVEVARTLARAVLAAPLMRGVRVCACGCGRRVSGRQLAATPACRKRMERRR